MAKVTVEALKSHTAAGEAYDVGDTYSVDEAAVENLAVQGMAARVDRVAHAKSLKVSKNGKLKPAKPSKPAKAVKKARKGKK